MVHQSMMWGERASEVIFKHRISGLLYLKEDLVNIESDWLASYMTGTATIVRKDNT
jgi:hypothetical protein